MIVVSALLSGCDAKVEIKSNPAMSPSHESAFRAGASVATRLIWENPDKYRTSSEVMDAAWKYALNYWETNSPANQK